MPTNPLYYQPLVRAAARSVPVNPGTGEILDAVANRQGSFRFNEVAPGQERQIMPITQGAAALTTDKEYRAGIEKSFTGLTALTDARAGARLDGVQLAFDDDGYVANRTFTALSTHPDMFDTDSPDAGAQRTMSIMDSVRQGGAVVKLEKGILDLPPALTSLLQQQWKGEAPVAVADAAMAAYQVSREIEKAATPPMGGLRSQSDAAATAWISSAIPTTIALWNGTTSKMTKALGFTADDAKVEEAVAGWRADAMKGAAGGDGEALITMAKLLSIAGLDPAKAADLPTAQNILQSGNQPHVMLAGRIIETLKLPGDKIDWLAGRIVDISGRPGNVDGLKSELDALTPKPPATSPGEPTKPAPTEPDKPVDPAPPAPVDPAPAPTPAPPTPAEPEPTPPAQGPTQPAPVTPEPTITPAS